MGRTAGCCIGRAGGLLRFRGLVRPGCGRRRGVMLLWPGGARLPWHCTHEYHPLHLASDDGQDPHAHPRPEISQLAITLAAACRLGRGVSPPGEQLGWRAGRLHRFASPGTSLVTVGVQAKAEGSNLLTVAMRWQITGEAAPRAKL